MMVQPLRQSLDAHGQEIDFAGVTGASRGAGLVKQPTERRGIDPSSDSQV